MAEDSRQMAFAKSCLPLLDLKVYSNNTTRDRIKEPLRLVGANGMAAVFEDPQLGARNVPLDFCRNFGRADPVAPTSENQCVSKR